MSTTDALAAYADYFATLTPQRLHALERLFAPDARFKDPFNDVRGVAAIRSVFEHMYRTLETPRFVVLDTAAAGPVGYLHWQFRFARNGRQHMITGLSRVVFDAGQRVVEHQDFWDPAEQVYESLPLLGAVLRWLKRRLATPA